jgi:acetoacetate decarboxylase
MRMPDVTGLGDYTESGQLAVVEFEGERGEYNIGMYVDSLPAIASGREIGAYPKKLGAPRLYVDSDTLVGTLDYGSLRVATATMGYKHRELTEEQAREELTIPTFMLKKLPGYDAKPRICELVRAQIWDLAVTGAWAGPARLQLFAHALAPLADLPVLEIVSASHLLTDLTLGKPVVVHDYLAS